MTLYLIPALKGRGCGVRISKESEQQSKKERDTANEDGWLSQLFLPLFCFDLTLFTPFSPLCSFLLFFTQGWSVSLVFSSSAHFPFPHSILAVCSFRTFISSHLFHTPHLSLYELVSFSRGLHCPCFQIPVYPLLLSSPCLLHPSICYSFSQTALLHFSHLTIQLFLATLSKLLPDPPLPLPRLSFSPQRILFLPLWHIFIILPFFSFFSLTPPFQTRFFHFLLLSFRNYYVVFFLISVSNSAIAELHPASDSNVDLRSVTRGGGDSISCWRQDSDFCSIVIIVVGKLSDKQHAVCFVL